MLGARAMKLTVWQQDWVCGRPVARRLSAFKISSFVFAVLQILFLNTRLIAALFHLLQNQLHLNPKLNANDPGKKNKSDENPTSQSEAEDATRPRTNTDWWTSDSVWATPVWGGDVSFSCVAEFLMTNMGELVNECLSINQRQTGAGRWTSFSLTLTCVPHLLLLVQDKGEAAQWWWLGSPPQGLHIFQDCLLHFSPLILEFIISIPTHIFSEMCLNSVLPLAEMTGSGHQVKTTEAEE